MSRSLPHVTTPKQPPLIYQQLVQEMGFDPSMVVSLPKRRGRGKDAKA